VVLSFSSQTCQSITCFAIGKNYLTFCSKAFSLCAYFTTCPFILTKHLGRFQKDSLSGIFHREPDLPLSLTWIVYKATPFILSSVLPLAPYLTVLPLIPDLTVRPLQTTLLVLWKLLHWSTPGQIVIPITTLEHWIVNSLR